MMRQLKNKLILISLLIFVISLFFDAFKIEDIGKITNFESYTVALIGFISFLGGGLFEFFVWTANCWFFLSILFTFRKKYSTSSIFGIIALCISASFMLWHEVLASGSGRTAKIQSLEVGYFLWLASILFITCSSVYSKITEKKNA
ncbi:hypothetical protein [Chryseobacterium sp.]|uniref:hypothetical protein n=1 Tax=Chryseobacterium sp. TaxID=1871047 RepID=UPI00289A6724|nr:hypothetical protein [Chryseobacterium sp.]